MRKLLVILSFAAAAAVAGAVVYLTTAVQPPGAPVEKAIPDDRLPR